VRLVTRLRPSRLLALLLGVALTTSACASKTTDGDEEAATAEPGQAAEPTAASVAAPGTAPAKTPSAAPAPGDAAAAAEPALRPEDIVTGQAAEALIAAGAGDPQAPTPLPVPEAVAASALLVDANGVGPYRLDAPRNTVDALLRGKAALRRVPGPAGAPTVEVATVFAARNRPLLRLRVYGGRLAQVDVLAVDPGAVTEENIGVGSTFEAAMAVHGEPRRAADPATGRPVGFTLSDLPGVIFATALPPGEVPLPTAKIARILVVGPEGD
jgi:hypothetical protein